jgi:hypothetical protein
MTLYNTELVLIVKVSDFSAFLCADNENVTVNIPLPTILWKTTVAIVKKYENV